MKHAVFILFAPLNCVFLTALCVRRRRRTMTVPAEHDARAGEQRGRDQDHAGAAVHAGAGHGPENVPDQLRAGLPRQAHGPGEGRVRVSVRPSVPHYFVRPLLVVLVVFLFLYLRTYVH